MFDEPLMAVAAQFGAEARSAAGSGSSGAGRLSLELVPPVSTTHAFAAKPLDLGLRWRQRLPSDQHIDITAWRRMNEQPNAYELIRQREGPTFGARVELKLKPARKTAFLAEHGFLGLQLDNGARITLRRKNGNPTLYYRATF